MTEAIATSDAPAPLTGDKPDLMSKFDAIIAERKALLKAAWERS